MGTAMQKNQKEHEINLLPQEEFDASSMGRILKWILSTFRYIVITTEIVVISAFLSRFFLDAKSNELTDAIIQKKAIIASYSTFETEYRSTQRRLDIFKNYTSSSLSITPIIDEITKNIPANTNLTELSINGSKVILSGEASEEASVSSFVTNLSASSFFQDVNLNSIQSKTDTNLLSFQIFANLKERKLNE